MNLDQRQVLKQTFCSLLIFAIVLTWAMPVTFIQRAVADTPVPGYSTYIIVFNDGPPGQSSEIIKAISEIIQSPNGRIKYVYSVINGIAVVMSDDLLGDIMNISGVKYVEKDNFVYAVLDRAVPLINADDVLSLGDNGYEVKVCVIDTGVDASHPDLNGGKVVGWIDYVQGSTTPYDDNGHGTHCAGTISGTGAASAGKYKGVAPGSSLLVAKALDFQGVGYDSDIIKAIDWAIQNGADVISMSLGGDYVRSLDEAVSNAVNNGVVVVVAAGNEGPFTGTIQCPGDNPDAITVGATDRIDVIASFSSRGPTYDNRIKPDVTAMGVGLVSAKANPSTSYYISMSGTSMATPMVAGVAALLLSKDPTLTSLQVKSAITSTAVHPGGTIPNNDYGFGRVDALAAYYSINIEPLASVTIVNIPLVMSPGNSYSVSITMNNTGTISWSEDDLFRLGAVGDLLGDAAEFGPVRVTIPQGTVVPPGHQYTFSFTMIAPDVPGTYTPSYQMVWDGREWFGEVVSRTITVQGQAPSLDAIVISNSIPSTMIAGQSIPVSITIRNNGTAFWNEHDLIRLGAVDDFNGDAVKFGPVRITIPQGTGVLPGEQYTFGLTMTAPLTAGVYTPSYRMVQDGNRWFGPTLAKTVTVTDNILQSPGSRYISDNIPATITRGQTFQASITLENTGNLTWSENNLVRLGAVDDYAGDAYRFGPVRSLLPAGITVAPGARYTWNFTITAPLASGIYHPSWRTVWDGQQWFGDRIDRTVTVT